MNRNNSKISNFFKEIAIVVIGVLIAVSINNFKENYENEKYIKKTLTAIQNEINQSEAAVKSVLKRHIERIDSVQVGLYNEQESLGDLVLRLGGIQSPEIKNIGLRFFISSKAELVDYQIIAQLSDIENSTELLDVKMKRLIDFMYDNITEKDKRTKTKFNYYLENVVNSESKLLELYAKFKTENKNYLKQ